MPLLYRFTASCLLLSLLISGACSSPNQASQTAPADPASDSLADGVSLTDTTVVDDDTLQVALPVQPKPNK